MAITPTRKPADRATDPLFAGQGSDTREQDFVEGILDLVCAVRPMSAQERKAASQAVRAHYGAGRHYVAARGPEDDSEALARKVLSSFNGQGARATARKLGIGKTTVYRVIKQAGKR
jgi:hypothetical protein